MFFLRILVIKKNLFYGLKSINGNVIFQSKKHIFFVFFIFERFYFKHNLQITQKECKKCGKFSLMLLTIFTNASIIYVYINIHLCKYL